MLSQLKLKFCDCWVISNPDITQNNENTFVHFRKYEIMWLKNELWTKLFGCNILATCLKKTPKQTPVSMHVAWHVLVFWTNFCIYSFAVALIKRLEVDILLPPWSKPVLLILSHPHCWKTSCEITHISGAEICWNHTNPNTAIQGDGRWSGIYRAGWPAGQQHCWGAEWLTLKQLNLRE